MAIMFYSGIFSAQRNDHPVPSIYSEITGEESPGQGMSRAFSEIVRFRFKSALTYNPYSLNLFSFFFIQFFLRIGISVALQFFNGKAKKIASWDIPLSVLLFVAGFYPFLAIWKHF